MRPKAYRWRSDVRLEALGDLGREALLGNRPLERRQEEAFAASGFVVEDVSDPAAIGDREFLLFADNLYVSPPLLRAFLAEARRRRGASCLQLALAESPFTAFAQFTGEQPTLEHEGRRAYRYGLYACRSQDGKPPARAAAEPVLVATGERRFTVPFSGRIATMTDLHVPVTDRVAFELTSWVHLWMANLFFIYVTFRERLRSPTAWPGLLGRAAAGVLLAGSLRPFPIALSILRRLVVRGRGCRIHPSAVVEACILGRNVDIGPQCVVRASIVGDGVRILEHSVVDGCVVGDDALVNPQGLVKLCLIHPGAVVNWLQAGVLGRSAFLGVFCRPLDMKLEGEVRVRHRGRLVSTGLSFLGCCVGHRAFVSADSVIAPGRVIPNDYKVLSDDSRHIRDVPEGLPTDHLLIERSGVVQPLRPTRVSEATADPPAGGIPGPAAAASPEPLPPAAAPRTPSTGLAEPRERGR